MNIKHIRIQLDEYEANLLSIVVIRSEMIARVLLHAKCISVDTTVKTEIRNIKYLLVAISNIIDIMHNTCTIVHINMQIVIFNFPLHLHL